MLKRIWILSILWLSTSATAQIPGWAGRTGVTVSGETFASTFNPTGDPVGGGRGYSDIRTSGDHTSTSRADFISDLAAATAGQTVFIAEGTTIDLGNQSTLTIPCNVTIASDRGKDKGGGAYSEGGIIHSTLLDTDSALQLTFRTPGTCTETQHIEITGLRLYGPSAWGGKNPNDLAGMIPVDSLGGMIRVYSPDSLTIHNNLIVGWDKWAVYALDQEYYAHHNTFLSTQRFGFGYGLWAGGSSSPPTNASPVAEANYFDACRHCTDTQGGKVRGLRDERYNWIGSQQAMPGNASLNTHETGEQAYRAYRNVFTQTTGSLMGSVSSAWNMVADSIVFRENWLGEAWTNATFSVYTKNGGTDNLSSVNTTSDLLCVSGDQTDDWADVGFAYFNDNNNPGNNGIWYYDSISYTSETCVTAVRDVTSTDLSVAGSPTIILGADSAHVFPYFADNRLFAGGNLDTLQAAPGHERFFNETLPAMSVPAPSATVTPPYCAAPCAIDFTESGTAHPDGHAIYFWEYNWDDGAYADAPATMVGRDWIGAQSKSYASGHTVSHTYTTPGIYKVRQTAVDEYGVRGDSIYTIEVRPSSGDYVFTGKLWSMWSDKETPEDSLYIRIKGEDRTGGAGTIVAMDSIDVGDFEIEPRSFDLVTKGLSGLAAGDSYRQYVDLIWDVNEDGHGGVEEGNTANKLIDNEATFSTWGVQVGDPVINVTRGLHGRVTGVDSETTLSIDNDMFVDAVSCGSTSCVYIVNNIMPDGRAGFRNLRIFGGDEFTEPNGDDNANGWTNRVSGTYSLGSFAEGWTGHRNGEAGLSFEHGINVASCCTTDRPYGGASSDITLGPKAPTGVTATPDTPATDNCRVAWTAPTGGSTYTIFRGTTSGEYDTTFADTASPYDDTTTVNGTTYYYRVSADDASGIESMWSAEDSCGV